MKISILSSVDPTAVSIIGALFEVNVVSGVPYASLPAWTAESDVLVFRGGVPISAELMAASPHLSLLIQIGSGIQDIDLNYLAANPIPLEQIPESCTRALAEDTFALMLGLTRQIRWLNNRTHPDGEQHRSHCGHTLEGKTLGIVGAGQIGATVGELGHLWGMQVLGCVDNRSAAAERRLRERGIRLASLTQVLRSADFLTIHMPLTDTTHNFIGLNELAQMKRGAFLINMAHAALVNEGALYASLLHGHLAGAGLGSRPGDSYAERSLLANLNNVIVTARNSAALVETGCTLGERIVELVTLRAGYQGVNSR